MTSQGPVFWVWPWNIRERDGACLDSACGYGQQIMKTSLFIFPLSLSSHLWLQFKFWKEKKNPSPTNILYKNCTDIICLKSGPHSLKTENKAWQGNMGQDVKSWVESCLHERKPRKPTNAFSSVQSNANDTIACFECLPWKVWGKKWIMRWLKLTCHSCWD